MGEGEFADIDVAAVGFHEIGEQVVKHEGGGFDVVGGEEEEAGFFGEGFAAEFQQLGELAFDFPDVAIGAASEGGGVEENAVVAGAAFDFAANIFEGVFDDPADGFCVQMGGNLVVAGPGGGGFGGVHVGGFPAGFGGDEGGGAGIAEEIEKPCAGGGGLLDGVPMGRLFGEHAEMFAGVGDAGKKGEGAEAEFPFAGATGAQFPAGVFVVDGLGAIPFGGRQAGFPPGLGFAANDGDGAKALEFEAAARVEQFVVGEASEGGLDGRSVIHRQGCRWC